MDGGWHTRRRPYLRRWAVFLYLFFVFRKSVTPAMSEPRPVSYGGEAVFDGVMMRGARHWSLAVRRPDGSIATEVHALPAWMTKAKSIPLVRGVLALAASVALGNKSLTASMRYRSDDPAPVTFRAKLATAFGVVLVLSVFLIIPAMLAHLLPGRDHAWILSSVEAFVRLAMIVGYIAALGLNREVKEVYRYHSAEHAAISAREDGRMLTPAEVAQYPNAHPRCGTAFLLLIVLTGIVVHAFVGTHDALTLAISRVVVLPVVAGVTYELIRAASRYSHTWFGRALAAPGIALQRLTTQPTTERHIEVAIAALQAVVEADERTAAVDIAVDPMVVSAA
jgi:uncharacterized protein YqhQ